MLIEESQTTINWFKANHIIVNPKKFQAISISKKKNTTPEDLTFVLMLYISNQTIQLNFSELLWTTN